MKFNRLLFIFLLMLTALPVTADWHGGKVYQVSVGYDGKTVAFRIEGWVRSNCTCYSSWSDHMCLDATRVTHDFEKALLLSARARGTTLNANIDETSCKVIALYEIN